MYKRQVPDPAYLPFAAIDVTRVDAILEEYDHDPAHMLQILEATQVAYGYLPVASLKRISQRTGAWYAMIYGTASYYGHLRFEPAEASGQAAAVAAHRPPEADYLAAFDAALAGAVKRGRGRTNPGTAGTPGDPTRPDR